MKKFVSGLLIGILIALSVTTFAAVELKIAPNPYDVIINGSKADVDGYNISGSTYLKLTDFKQAGLEVSFNKDSKEIEITTPSAQTTEAIESAPKTIPESTPESIEPTPESTVSAPVEAEPTPSITDGGETKVDKPITESKKRPLPEVDNSVPIIVVNGDR